MNKLRQQEKKAGKEITWFKARRVCCFTITSSGRQGVGLVQKIKQTVSQFRAGPSVESSNLKKLFQ